MKYIPNLRAVRLTKSGVLTIGVMVAVVLVGVLYLLFRDQSLLQKHKQTPAAQALIIEDDAAAFTDLSQNKVPLNEDFGKVLVVMSWASWCPQCGKDLESLGALAKDYQGRDVRIMAINRAEDKYSAERFLSTLQVPGELRIILDPTDHYFANSEGYAMPETIVFHKDGTVALHQRGEVRLDEIRATIDAAEKE